MTSVGHYEAVDWYDQHAAMVLEWIRRHDPRLSKELKEFLFSDKPIAHG